MRVSWLCAGLFLWGVLACLPVMAAAPPDARAAAVAASLSEESLQADLVELQALADEAGGNRAASEPGHEASADYIESQLAGLGLRVWRQPFEFTWRDSRASLDVEGDDRFDVVAIGEYSTAPEGIAGPLVAPADAYGCTAASWGGVDLTGKVVIVRSRVEPDCNTRSQMELARGRGAVALLTFPVTVGFPNEFPALFLRDDDQAEALLAQALLGGAGIARVTASYRVERRTSFNLLAETPVQGPTIMLGAHLDSVPAGPGLDDNASGSAAVLEIARRLAAQTWPARLRFAWWGAEEHGLVGSAAYVNQLADHDLEGLSSIRAYLNADMIGSPNHAFAIYDPSEEEPAVQRQRIHDALDSYFVQAGVPRLRMTSRMFSDHRPFAQCGLAIGGLSSFPAVHDKTVEEQQLFGGQAGESYNRNYHLVSDRLENTSRAAWGPLARSLAYAMADLAQAPPAAVAPDCAGLNALTEEAARHFQQERARLPQAIPAGRRP